jgi:hypothetical protein
MPPTPLTDCSHMDRLEKLQSSEAPSEYCAQYGMPCAYADANVNK